LEGSPVRFEIKGTKAYIRCVFEGEWKYHFHHGANSSEIDEGTMLAFVAHELISSGAQDYLNKAAAVYKKKA
jgi:hypothetical protein